MKIGIYNCNIELCDYLHILIQTYADQNKKVIKIYNIKNQELLYNCQCSFDMIFINLDINKNKIISEFKHLRLIDCSCLYIFLSTKPSVDSFIIISNSYLLTKGFSYKHIKEIFDIYFFNNTNNIIEISINRDILNIDTNKIIMIESTKNGSIIYFTNDYYLNNHNSLKKWETLLNPNNFFRCNQSYIVSIPKILSITNSINLINGYKASLSRGKKKILKQQWMNFKINYS